MKYDIIVIGGGLGGLTAGAKLSKEGKKVLLIEQHSIPGGCATTFKRGDFTLEVGLHEMDGPGPRDMKTRIFNDLGVFSNVTFPRVPEFYRFVSDRVSVTVPHDPVKAADVLTELYPGEAAGIKSYFEQILNPRKKGAENEVKETSIGEYLDSIIANDDLKLILLGNLGYFHDDPYSLSLAYYTIAQGSYYSGGASFIKGGSQSLSDYLAGYIRTHGGEVLLSHLVTGINTADGKAVGISFKKKGSNDILEVYADEIIANSALPDLPALLPGELGKSLENEIEGPRAGASLLTLYLGFNKPPKELGNKFYSTCVFDGSVRSQADIFNNGRDDFSRRDFIFVDYGQIDSGLANGNKSVGAVCCIDYLDQWSGLGREEYKERKEQVASVLIDRLDKIVPGIKSTIGYHEVGTPATVKRYTLNPGGAVYGYAQTPSRKIVDQLKSVENLHIASAWGRTGGGFSGAIYGGYLCALNILRKR
ncbi:MAG: NAD(P)/FAD-dependent oxidoreductase [Bacteroidales bacterium]